jgi:hypothetical protein
MYMVFLNEVESHAGEYCSYTGVGRSLRSVKVAGDIARTALRHSRKIGGSRKEPMWTGTPILGEVRITRNGRVIHQEY